MHPKACFPAALLAFSLPLAAAQSVLTPATDSDRAEAKAIFKQLIEINTTDTPRGSVTAATQAMEKRFLDAGFPREDVHLLGPEPAKR